MTYVRLENLHTGEEELHGPFPFAQLTYNILRVGPDGDELVSFDTMMDVWVDTDDIKRWTDVVIYAS